MAISGVLLLRRKEWSTVAKRRIVPPKFTVRLGGIWTRNSNGRTTETSASLVLLSDHRLISNDMNIRVRHRGAVPPGLKKSNLAEFSQGETEKSDLNPEFRRAGVAAG